MSKEKTYVIEGTLEGSCSITVTSKKPPEDFNSIRDFYLQSTFVDEMVEPDIASMDDVWEDV